MDKKALYSISYGLYIICSKKAENINGQVANTVFQISSDPVTIAVSINKNNLTHEYIMESQAFTISVLDQDAPLSIIGQFGFKSGRESNKFEGINYRTTASGVPYISEHTLSYMEASVIRIIDAGTHTIFIGEMNAAEVLKNGVPMTYAYYHQKKSDATKETPKSADRKSNYQCTVCGYIYQPDKGDPEHGIEPGTAFEDIPDDWTCPICGMGKDKFDKL